MKGGEITVAKANLPNVQISLATTNNFDGIFQTKYANKGGTIALPGAGGSDNWKFTGWTCHACGGTGRRRFPKGTDFKEISGKEVDKAMHWLNHYPREIFDFASAEELFQQEILSLAQTI